MNEGGNADNTSVPNHHQDVVLAALRDYLLR